jgi:hypothetical protein
MAGNSLKHGRIEIAMMALLVIASVATARGRKSLGEIDFFGYKGLNVTAIRAALPFYEGDLFPPSTVKSSDDLKRQVSEKIKQVIGQEPTDISFVCCDAGQSWIVYIGLPGESWRTLAFNPSPTGRIRFSPFGTTHCATRPGF